MEQSVGQAAHRRYARLVALACGALYLAFIVAGFGLLSLWSNTEVIATQGLGLLDGPIMAAVSVLTLTALLFVRAPRAVGVGLDWAYAVLVALLAGLSYLLAGFVVGLVDVGVGAGVDVVLHALSSGYAVLATASAVLVALLYSWVISRRYDERGRPRWMWEDEFDA